MVVGIVGAYLYNRNDRGGSIVINIRARSCCSVMSPCTEGMNVLDPYRFTPHRHSRYEPACGLCEA